MRTRNKDRRVSQINHAVEELARLNIATKDDQLLLTQVQSLKGLVDKFDAELREDSE